VKYHQFHETEWDRQERGGYRSHAPRRSAPPRKTPHPVEVYYVVRGQTPKKVDEGRKICEGET
jgi:hypothetical protein